MTKPNKRVKTSISRKSRYQENAYEKSTLSHLGQRYLTRGICSPTQSKARDVIRKYRMQLRKLEFKRLKNLVPTIKETSDEQSEVSDHNQHCYAVKEIMEFKGFSKLKLSLH